MIVLRGLLGVAILLFLAWLMSSGRRQVNWRLVVGGLLLQLGIAVLVLTPWFPWFATLVGGVSKGLVTVMDYSLEGSKFVFGDLADSSHMGFVLAFQILPTIIFVSALTSLLYYFGILQWVVFGLAWVMSRLMRLSGAESLATAANVFVGQTEAPLMVKPYIPKMTRSEMMALMTGGMATIAGGVLAFYVSILGGDSDESRQAFATILLCASLMNAPAALLVAKIIIPETEEVDGDLFIPKEKIGSNPLDALAQGTTEGLKLAFNVGAMLIVFIALVAMINGFLGWAGGCFNYPDLSLGLIVGCLFAPIAWAVGINSGEILAVGELLGLKMVSNELFAYTRLTEIQGELSQRSVQIATFALCGFANFSSVGIQLGGIGALAPEQRPVLAALGFKAMLAGTLASLLTATIAGIFYS